MLPCSELTYIDGSWSVPVLIQKLDIPNKVDYTQKVYTTPEEVLLATTKL